MKNCKKVILAGAALLAVPALCSAGLITSFESGTLDGWTADAMNGSVGSVSMDRASDGSYSYSNTFTVPSSYSGWGVASILENAAADMGITDSTTSVSLDVYSDWANPNGWGVYGNSVKLVLSYEGGWIAVNPVADPGLVNGVFQTFTFDMTPYAATISDVNLSYSNVAISWFLGTWMDDGLANGTQTLAVDNIQVFPGQVAAPGAVSVPEPATLGLLGFAGIGALLTRRRRFKM